eukprot:TRINITY_DN23213_c0_g1_i1.p1 TRINITY_DN23213_c0_g1~~TRINITY_DN23213_c0_g1_i1.p1  ORF type:complete len:1613 (-),score=322.65 TRINITY_DN23213_c0_g1_i1:59-4897(-)
MPHYSRWRFCRRECWAAVAAVLAFSGTDSSGPAFARALEVEVSAAASWSRASLAAELLEGLREVDQGVAFLRSLSQTSSAGPLEWRRAAARAAEASLCCAGSSSYAKLLSLRARHASSSAAVEAARGLEQLDLQAAAADEKSGCSKGSPWAAVWMPGKPVEALCGADALAGLPALVGSASATGADSSEKRSGPMRTSLDHVLYELSSAEHTYPEVVGYADLGDPTASASLLSALVKAADELAANGHLGRVAFRHGAVAGDVPRAALAGYGLELFGRSADEVAKSADGSAAASGSNESDCNLGAENFTDPADFFHGVDLGVLAKRHPESASALCHLRGDLISQAERPLPPWELKRLGAKAAMRAISIANKSGGAAGLASIGEVAQDYPSGWGRALAGGSSDDEAIARDLLDRAEMIQGAESLEVNGWRVPEKQRGVLPLLRSQLPIFKAVEVLARTGFDQGRLFRLLRDSRPGAVPPSSVNTGDPRLPGESSAAAVFNFPRGMGQKRVVGVGLVLDPCRRSQMKFLQELMQEPVPGVMWLQLKSNSNPRLAAFMQSGIEALLNGAPNAAEIAETPGEEAALRVLMRFYEKKKDGAEDLCDSEAKKRFMGPWKKAWTSEPPKLKMLSDEDDFVDEVALPVPSACINGNMLMGPDIIQTLIAEINEERDLSYRSLEMMRIPIQYVDESMIANWQYSGKKMSHVAFRTTPSFLRAWYPGISTGAQIRHVSLAPQLVKSAPGGFLAPGDDALHRQFPAVHTVIVSGEGEGGASLLRYLGELLEAYQQLSSHKVASGGLAPKRALHVAVTGGCASDDLTITAALRRCLAAAMPAAHSPLDLNVMKNLGRTLRSCKVAPAAVLDACSQIVGAAREEILKPQVVKTSPADVDRCRQQSPLIQAVGNPAKGTALLSLNGRIFGPLDVEKGVFALNPAALLQAEELELDYGPVLLRDDNADLHEATVVSELGSAGASDEDLYQLAFALSVRSKAVFESIAARSGADSDEEEQEHSLFRGPAEMAFRNAPQGLRLNVQPLDPSTATVQIYAMFDPLSKEAQQLPPLLQLMHEELGMEISVVLRPSQLAETPLSGYYRAAGVPPAPAGGLAALGEWDGSMPGLRLQFPPRNGQLLSAQLLAPEAWTCSPVDSGGADLDSLKADAPRGSPEAKVQVRYVVEALFLEGFAEMGADAFRRRPAAGRQLALNPLGRQTSSAAGADSVVVKSGYFQLRQPPGLYKLALRGSEQEHVSRPRGLVQLTDLAGRGALLEVNIGDGSASSEEGAVEAQMAAPSGEQSESFEGSGGDPSVCNDTIHIFSVASGLRYERLLRIMMLSVRRHTQCKLRFWLVENFLSPSFRRLLPGLAKQVGFSVSRVTYKWPSWLREQTQKQRVIWAYKILFLDVLFPAPVKRILFIDADQIVRANVEELWRMNLQGHVYGFVPFCGSGPPESISSSLWNSLTGGTKNQDEIRNPETQGFRFWEQGFWKNHLGSSTYYHISALFVVDLEAFRKTAAGDILRDVYQSLTADPHSLANLDQDLPNYIQRQLPIYSLPQEWLWCESWCSEASKQNAKTIDMCQNPVRKEGKLQQAKRIAPEWSKYDDELQTIIDQLERGAAPLQRDEL